MQISTTASLQDSNKNPLLSAEGFCIKITVSILLTVIACYSET